MRSEVRVEVTLPIATVRLDHPEKHNVLTVHGWRALAEALERFSEQGDIGCVVVTGAGGRAFSAGSDISAFSEERDTPEDVRAYADAIARALRAIRCCPHPTVAVIEGVCVGGGLDRLGLTMSYEELEPLVQLLGASPLLDILLSGELIRAERALAYGLVNRVHPDAAVVEQGYGLAARIAAGAPLVNRWHKKFVRRLHERTPLSEAERAEPHQAFTTRDYREGRAAFLEKREPRFRGE
jgi:enoyl-CoA hydratase/carnithine racemase